LNKKCGLIWSFKTASSEANFWIAFLFFCLTFSQSFHNTMEVLTLVTMMVIKKSKTVARNTHRSGRGGPNPKFGIGPLSIWVGNALIKHVNLPIA